MSSNSSTLNLLNPHFSEMCVFWWPGNLDFAQRRVSIIYSLFCSLVRMALMTWPVTNSHCPCALGLSKAPHISLSGAQAGTPCQSRMSTEKDCPQGPLGQPARAHALRRALCEATAHWIPVGKRLSGRNVVRSKARRSCGPFACNVPVKTHRHLTRRTFLWMCPGNLCRNGKGALV